jgi:hypothetical protein
VPRHTRGSGARGQQEMPFDQRLRGMFCRNAEGVGRRCLLGLPGLAVVPAQGLEASRISVSLQRARTVSVAQRNRPARTRSRPMDGVARPSQAPSVHV